MTTKTKEVRIGAISLNNAGSNGLVVKYEQTEIRNNREFFTEYSAKKRFPIHQELNDKFVELIPFLLELCNYETSTELMSGVTMTGITYSDKGFLISGKMSAIANKAFAINTPLITNEDGYPEFAKVSEIMDSIYAETKEYMEGKKVLSDIQYVLNLNKANTAFDAKEFESLPAEEQWKIASEFMAKNKCIVTKLDDMEETSEPEVEIEPVLEVKTNDTKPEQVSDEDWVPTMEVVEESTAKKKKVG